MELLWTTLITQTVILFLYPICYSHYMVFPSRIFITCLLIGGWGFSYTIFATHMEKLSQVASIYPNVKILHFNVEVKNNRLDFKVNLMYVCMYYQQQQQQINMLLIMIWIPLQFELKDGRRHVPHYGLLLAGVAGLPTSVIETAKNITSRITEKVINSFLGFLSCGFQQMKEEDYN